MKAPDVLVCLKWVSTRTEVDQLTGEVTTDARFSGISPADASALEWGLQIAGSLGANLTVATVGPPEAEAALADAIACGAGRAVRVDAPTLVSSEATAAPLAMIGANHQLIVCGDYSIDRGSGSVPAFIAHRLGLPQALGLISLEVERGRLTATRRLDQGRRERLALRLPTVISFESGLELRRATLSSTLSATSATIEVLQLPETSGLATSPVSIGLTPFKPRTKVIPPPLGNASERVAELAHIEHEQMAARTVALEPERAADVALAQLQEWGYF